MASDGGRVRTVIHFVGSVGKTAVCGDEWVRECVSKADIAKWQVFADGDRITHIVNMDNVAFIEVVDDA